MMTFGQSMVVYQIHVSIFKPNIVEPVVKWTLQSDRTSNASYKRQVRHLTLDLFTCLQFPSYFHPPTP